MASMEFFNDFCKQVDADSLAQSYTYTSTLGAGSFGTVMEATQISSGKRVAVKVISKDSLEEEHDLEGLVNEVTTLQMLKHDNILAFHEALHDEFNVYIVTELCPDGDLIDYMEADDDHKVEELDALILLQQVLRALVYVHGKGIAHRDIKLDNVMRIGDKVKLIDFGLAYVQGSNEEASCTSYAGTVIYSAPEALERIPHCPRVADMWSCGVLLYAMLSGKEEFLVASEEDETFNLELISHASFETVELFENLLNEDPVQRISAEEALAVVDNIIDELADQQTIF